jgi:hypothetical protein
LDFLADQVKPGLENIGQIEQPKQIFGEIEQPKHTFGGEMIAPVQVVYTNDDVYK